ncbi:MAG: hypothetical protein CM1200mP41_29110 [Gammaproteobacteria bacterium]|nr:MAG: hypothetical protein CM1200mP41_29110 [Gammaproteobacteria bacterium]
MTLPFTQHEYEQRLAKTRRAMEERNIQLLWVADPSNMAWLTGYDGWSFYVHQGVLSPPSVNRSGLAANKTLKAHVVLSGWITRVSSAIPTLMFNRPSDIPWIISRT